MIPSYLSPLFNHLWQSTLVAALAGILAVLLRNNRAQARYWVWLIVSLKFLIPFSLLIAVGSRLGSSTAPAAAPAGFSAAPAGFAFMVQQFGRPFAPAPSHVVATPGLPVSHSDFLPALLLAVWLVGFAVVLLRWRANWQRVQAAICAGTPLPIAANVPVLSTPALLEPGVFGIFRPVLVLPEGITEHLAPAQLSAVLAHELCHVRRCDNLAAALHMLVEAIFWFHPLVWWLGARLVEERERACDEEVLSMGNEPATYAESILKVCQFYLGSPLACMSGVTGSDLKQRVIRIMTHRVVRKLDLGRKLLLAAAGMSAVAGPVAFGLANAPSAQTQSGTQSQPSSTDRLTFEAASIKPAKSGDMRSGIRMAPGGLLTATSVSLKMLMTMAYKIQPFQLTGAPSWLDSDRWDIEAKPESGADDEPGKSPADEEKRMDAERLRIRSLLEDRCKLTFHHETKELPVYALVIAKNGPKLKESAIETPQQFPPGADKNPTNTDGEGTGRLPSRERALSGGPKRHMMMGLGQLSGEGVPVSFLAETLSRQLGRVVLDRTGLKGNYDFDLKWTPDPSQGRGMGMGGPPMGPGGPGGPGSPGGPGMPPPPDSNGPTIFTAVQEQLGLKLESQKGPVDVIVIDHIEKPSEN
jgi:uncharacterized protein (TIGR03435 family)